LQHGRFLPPRPAGDIVVADNLSSHKVAWVHEAVTAGGPKSSYCRPIRPASTPLKNFYAKLKALLCKAAERHFDALVDRIKIILQSVTIE
jgi:hypothetical protein